MRKNVLLVCLAAIGAAAVSSSVAVAAENWLGTWKLDVSKSRYSAGAPQAQTVKFEATPAGIKLTADGVNADGKPLHSSYTSKFDGKDVAWEGNSAADTAAPKKIDDNNYENTWKKSGKTVIVAKVSVSEDGKTLTVTETGTDAKGQPVNVVEVYNRQ